MSTPTTNYGYIKAAEGEQYDVDITNNNLDALDATDKGLQNALDILPKGLLFQVHVATSTGTVVGPAVVNNIPTFTFKANRKYRIVWDFSYYHTGNADSLFYCQISFAPTADTAASTSNLTSTDGRTKFIQTFAGASTGSTGPITKYHQTGGADQTTQIKFLCSRVYGDDGIIVVGNANERVVYSIYDDGLAAGSFG
jgi:hypothetical protein